MVKVIVPCEERMDDNFEGNFTSHQALTETCTENRIVVTVLQIEMGCRGFLRHCGEPLVCLGSQDNVGDDEVRLLNVLPGITPIRYGRPGTSECAVVAAEVGLGSDASCWCTDAAS